MPRYYFDCLSNGVLHHDEFGIEMLPEDIADQAQAALISIMEELIPNKVSLVVIVTVRTEQGQSVYVAHGIVGGYAVKQAISYSVEKPAAN